MPINPLDSLGEMQCVSRFSQISVFLMPHEIGHTRGLKSDHRGAAGQTLQGGVAQAFLQRRKKKNSCRAVVGGKQISPTDLSGEMAGIRPGFPTALPAAEKNEPDPRMVHRGKSPKPGNGLPELGRPFVPVGTGG